MDLYLIFGIAGMCCLLFTFVMNQLGRMSQNDISYDMINAVGGFLLVVYGIAGHAWPFVVLNAVWCLYSTKDVILGLTKKSQKHI